MSNQFFVKLIPNRATFAQDMTAEEAEIMHKHGAFWADLMHKQHVIVFGPVFDPAGVFGMGIVEAEDEAAVQTLLESDPAKVLNRYEIYAMRAVHPGQVSNSA